MTLYREDIEIDLNAFSRGLGSPDSSFDRNTPSACEYIALTKPLKFGGVTKSGVVQRFDSNPLYVFQSRDIKIKSKAYRGPMANRRSRVGLAV